jgi:predicted ATP-grasp superfamily ATP-dependent carboligase
VGVDVVLAPGGSVLIEVNARVTTSFVGLRRVADVDVAEAVWRACSLGELPVAAGTTGEVAFHKEGCGVC